MTVKQLILALQEHPDDLEIYFMLKDPEYKNAEMLLQLKLEYMERYINYDYTEINGGEINYLDICFQLLNKG